MPDWFHALTGFREQHYHATREQLEVDGRVLRSCVNGRQFGIGELTMPSLAALRLRAADAAADLAGPLRRSAIVGDVGALHRDAANRRALFQVASQFNLLEMTGPDITPEHGVTRYASDPTQGPACAIAAGAATIYRNYFVPVDGGPGQTATRQLDGLRDIGEALGNNGGSLWTMRNGYALCSEAGLAAIDRRLASLTEAEVDDLRGRLRVGIHSDVEVTTAGEPGQVVSQVFCAALPVAYSHVPSPRWARFATLVLEAAYEATLLAAIVNAAERGSRVVYLTSLGGGAFGNDRRWIDAAMTRAFAAVGDVALDVRVVRRG